MSQKENALKSVMPLSGANPCQTVDLPEENRTGVLEIKNTAEWYVVQCDLSEYSQQYITIKFSADVKRVGASGDLIWQINNKNYPRAGNLIKKAATDTWHKMWGEWTGVLEDSHPLLYLCTWKNNSEKTTYYVDNFNAEIIVNPDVKKAITTQRPLSDMAKYLKSSVPVNIPAAYSLKSMFTNISSEEEIRNGVLAFRDFLCQLFDRFIEDGSQYEKQKKENAALEKHPNLLDGYPFIYYVKSVLINIGYHGNLTERRDLMTLSDWKLLTEAISSDGYPTKTKISASKVMECLRFLTLCGIHFDGIDLDIEKPNKSNVKPINITYPDDSAILTGLKVMATAQRELHIKGKEDTFLRCDYRVLSNEEQDIIDTLRDYIYPLPAETQEFLLKLHRHYLSIGLNCQIKISTLDVMFSYMYKSDVLWEYSSSFNSGYRIFFKAKNIHKYYDVISQYPLPLQAIISKGFGCEKKRFGQPCEQGCHGFSIPLNNSFSEISKYVEAWIDKEFSNLHRN
ncbi:MAG: hypothetical protein FWE27_04520 [Defluviitaleaceae bacterium]|nr:hypothetical protein [Defluviitaleaceae bacterium]